MSSLRTNIGVWPTTSLWQDPQRSDVLAFDQNSCWNFRTSASRATGPVYGASPGGVACVSGFSVVAAPPPQAASTVLAKTPNAAARNTRMLVTRGEQVAILFAVFIILSPYWPM